MNAVTFTALCKRLGACNEGLKWIKGKSLGQFWATCERADWMLWFCGKMAGQPGWPTRQEIVLVACLCAERSLPIFEKKYPNDDRLRHVIETVRAWAKGECDIEEVRKARRASYAAYAADASSYAAYAAYAADASSYAAYAAYYAADATDAVAYASYADAAAASYADAAAAYAAAARAAASGQAVGPARDKELREMAAIVRGTLKVPTKGIQ